MKKNSKIYKRFRVSTKRFNPKYKRFNPQYKRFIYPYKRYIKVLHKRTPVVKTHCKYLSSL